MCDILCGVGGYSAAGSHIILARRLLTTPANGLADFSSTFEHHNGKKHAVFCEVENRRAIMRGDVEGRQGGSL